MLEFNSPQLDLHVACTVDWRRCFFLPVGFKVIYSKSLFCHLNVLLIGRLPTIVQFSSEMGRLIWLVMKFRAVFEVELKSAFLEDQLSEQIERRENFMIRGNLWPLKPVRNRFWGAKFGVEHVFPRAERITLRHGYLHLITLSALKLLNRGSTRSSSAEPG